MFKLTSPAFSDGGPIPRAHTCDGADMSPPLTIAGVPDGAQELALIVDDPDAPAGVWTHWVLYKLPRSTSVLAPGLAREPELPAPLSARQGANDFRRVGWGGPCPPKGRPHHYAFTLYALDSKLDVPPGATKAVVLAAIEGKVIAQANLVGTYGR